jgi:hypothetical protein
VFGFSYAFLEELRASFKCTRKGEFFLVKDSLDMVDLLGKFRKGITLQ